MTMKKTKPNLIVLIETYRRALEAKALAYAASSRAYAEYELLQSRACHACPPVERAREALESHLVPDYHT